MTKTISLFYGFTLIGGAWSLYRLYLAYAGNTLDLQAAILATSVTVVLYCIARSVEKFLTVN